MCFEFNAIGCLSIFILQYKKLESHLFPFPLKNVDKLF